MSGESFGRSITVVIVGHLLALSVVSAGLASTDLGSPGLGMRLSGVVLDSEGRPLADAEVTLFRVDRAATATARTDARGNFVFRRIYSGRYGFIVAARNVIRITNAPQDPSAVRVDVEAGVNVEGLLLRLPPPGRLIPSSASTASLRSATMQAAQPPPTPTPYPLSLSCDTPVKQDLPEQRLVVERSQGIAVPEPIPITNFCEKPDNFGCLRYDLIYPDIKCNQSTAFKHKVEAGTLVTQAYIRPPDWIRWQQGIPPCKANGFNFGGGEAHECGHRSGIEAKVKEAWATLLETVANLNATCGVDCTCRDPLVKEALGELSTELETYRLTQWETDALNAEHAYYQTQGCSP